MSKTWICDCGYETEWEYEDLVAKGEPVCPECDSNMKLKKGRKT